MRSIVLHGHYYQPPRENPWLERVEAEASAVPFHDWNQRIERECYRAVAAARVAAPDGRIAQVINALAFTSFNFGPTLLEWLDREAPATYQAVIDADRSSRLRLGHGNALAQPYHHVILPLASRRDKLTEVRWGIADFRRCFGREPEGMWLPETAVDNETLEVLAGAGIRFTVLAPHQVRAAPAAGFPGTVRTRSGARITVFPYHGPLSSGVAFGPLIRDAAVWSERLLAAHPQSESDSLVAIATDGETYGHHHRFGEMALAKLIVELEARSDVRLENFASFLAAHPDLEEVEVVENTSWSCAHGIERWRADCGCKMAPERSTSQLWRAPLRESLHQLEAHVDTLYVREATPLVGDPWRARDAYPESLAGVSARGRELLEMERDLLAAFTSCAWFFDEVSGLEPLQALRYAAHALELAGAAGTPMEDRFVAGLSDEAQEVYREKAKPLSISVVRAAAGFAALGHLGAAPGRLGVFTAEWEPGMVKFCHARTGVVREFRAEVEWLGGRNLAVTVCETAATPVRFTLEQLDEPERSEVVRRLRRRLIERALSESDRQQLAGAEVSLAGISEEALLRGIAGLEQDSSEDAVDRVLDLLSLLALEGEVVPYDAQSVFARLPVRPARVAAALGFSESAVVVGPHDGGARARDLDR